jgi:hypothetical protein
LLFHSREKSAMPTISFAAGNDKASDPMHPQQGTSVQVAGEGFRPLAQVDIRVVDKNTDGALANALADVSADGSFQWGHNISERGCFNNLLAVVRADGTELTATAKVLCH